MAKTHEFIVKFGEVYPVPENIILTALTEMSFHQIFFN